MRKSTPFLVVYRYPQQLSKRDLLQRDFRTNIVSCTTVSHEPSGLAQALISFAAVLLAIFPWIALLFTAILIVVLFAAARRRDQPETASQASIAEREKGSLDG